MLLKDASWILGRHLTEALSKRHSTGESEALVRRSTFDQGDRS